MVRSAYNNGLKYKIHSPADRVDVLYKLIVNKMHMNHVVENCSIKYNTLLNIYDDFVNQRGKIFEFHEIDQNQPIDISEPFRLIWNRSMN